MLITVQADNQWIPRSLSHNCHESCQMYLFIFLDMVETFNTVTLNQ